MMSRRRRCTLPPRLPQRCGSVYRYLSIVLLLLPSTNTLLQLGCRHVVSALQPAVDPLAAGRAAVAAAPAAAKACTPLPIGLSPYEHAPSLPATLRTLAATAIDRAIRDGHRHLEIDFPPLTGYKPDTTYDQDDYDVDAPDLTEREATRDWCAQLLPLLKKKNGVANEAAWLVLSNKEQRELAASTHGPSDDQTQFTTIRAVHAAVVPATEPEASSAETTVDQVSKEEDDDVVVLLEEAADEEPSLSSRTNTLDENEKPLTLVNNRFQLFCQPGNLGLLEEWVQLEQIVNADNNDKAHKKTVVTCVVNGALDAVRDGLYPAKYFPELTNTIPCYQKFTPVLIAKPIVVKGGGYMGWVPDDVYGWLFRVYPEPWQVYLQTARWEKYSKETRVPPKRIVENRIVMVSETRPNDADCLRPLMVVRDVNKIRYRPL
jgi:hypothetical protein